MLMRCDEDRVARCRDVRMCSHSTGSRALTACVYTCVYTLCVSISLCVRRFSPTAAGSLGSRATAAPRPSPAPASSGTTQSPPRTRSGLTRDISTFYHTRVQVVSEREEEELLSLSPQPSIISTVTHGATKKNLIHPSKERDYGGAKYGGGASTERAEVTTDTFTQPYPLAHHLVVHITLFQFSCPPFLQFSGSFYIISDFGDFNMQCTI